MRITSVNTLVMVKSSGTNVIKQKRNLGSIGAGNGQEITFKNQQLKSTGVKLAKATIGGLAGLGLGVLTGGLGLLILPGIGAVAGAIKGDSDDRRDHPENYKGDYSSSDYGDYYP